MGGVFQPSTAAQYILLYLTVFGVSGDGNLQYMDRKMPELMQRNNFYTK